MEAVNDNGEEPMSVKLPPVTLNPAAFAPRLKTFIMRFEGTNASSVTAALAVVVGAFTAMV